MSCKDVMIDLETLGLTADAVILSIGAVKFNLDSDEVDDDAFYASVSIDSNLELGRRIDEGTLIWWMGQSAQAQRVFTEPKSPLGAALEDLTEWLGSASDLRVWSNGADFDIPMLAHAFRQHGWAVPWKFYNARCFRTYKSLPQAKKAKFESVEGKHHAMVDALNQARQAQAISAVLTGVTA